ncbi:GNAT family N-acetyltransferase [Paraburkholderia acidicola]|nr:GNAT family N-acetyltransferase [Paraburkholderia acidicola]
MAENSGGWSLHRNKLITASEYSSLMSSAGWGSDYPEPKVRKSLEAYPFVAHARSDTGQLWGYVSAFSDGTFTTMLGELVVHADARRLGIGRALLNMVEQEFHGVPVYVKPLGEAKHFFIACGYRQPATEMVVLYHRNGT